MADPNRLPTAPTSPTPLWVISLFVSLTELVTGYAVTRATGDVQVALTAFAIAFPSVIALAFFLVLWFKNYVFWPPSEFSGAVDVTRYVEAMQRRTIDQQRIHLIIREAVATALDQTKETTVSELITGDADRAVEKVTQAALAKVDASIVSVKTETLPGSAGEVLAIPYETNLPIQSVLDDIWFAISDVVPAYSYGKAWVIRDIHSKHIYDVGRTWARRNGFKEDKRSLINVGIVPGAELEVVPAPRSRSALDAA